MNQAWVPNKSFLFVGGTSKSSIFQLRVIQDALVMCIRDRQQEFFTSRSTRECVCSRAGNVKDVQPDYSTSPSEFGGMDMHLQAPSVFAHASLNVTYM